MNPMSTDSLVELRSSESSSVYIIGGDIPNHNVQHNVEYKPHTSRDHQQNKSSIGTVNSNASVKEKKQVKAY